MFGRRVGWVVSGMKSRSGFRHAEKPCRRRRRGRITGHTLGLRPCRLTERPSGWAVPSPSDSSTWLCRRPRCDKGVSRPLPAEFTDPRQRLTHASSHPCAACAGVSAIDFGCVGHGTTLCGPPSRRGHHADGAVRVLGDKSLGSGCRVYSMAP